ncbi:MerR family transcriptional regulator [Aliicoccus persicus]|uniref:MerR HTH family regulatory protein n=1 Tax=Aliicoccus persicus TaxID=930138 RepID=A0A662Z4U2_9STAP|nr:MerR family transcriptional regulator [Aliicoccus persicus]SEV95394.1 MerR HTH family regulatory protein [Aliicoccus persicus]
MENNSTIFFTTAQVTEMVELSDQNVRKYVRLLEDRNYEVTKDEHNRRLFSGEDIAVLRELIKLAKQPGYTLETAADHIASKATGDVVQSNSRVPVVETNNEVTQLLTSVVDKMQEMQNDHQELREKMDQLLSKLDETSVALENNNQLRETNDSKVGAEVEEEVSQEEESEEETSNEEEKDAEEPVDTDEVKTDETEEKEDTEESQSEDPTGEEAQTVEKFEAHKRENERSVDMSSYENEKPESSSDNGGATSEQVEEKGAFSKFLDFLRGK